MFSRQQAAEAGLTARALSYRVEEGDISEDPPLDFLFREAPLGVLLNGYWCHMGRPAWAKEIDQGNALLLLGLPVINLTWDLVTKQPQKVAEKTRSALEGAAQSKTMGTSTTSPVGSRQSDLLIR